MRDYDPPEIEIDPTDWTGFTDEEVLCTPTTALACVHATSKKCNCACGGANHGRERKRTTIRRGK